MGPRDPDPRADAGAAHARSVRGRPHAARHDLDPRDDRAPVRSRTGRLARREDAGHVVRVQGEGRPPTAGPLNPGAAPRAPARGAARISSGPTARDRGPPAWLPVPGTCTVVALRRRGGAVAPRGESTTSARPRRAPPGGGPPLRRERRGGSPAPRGPEIGRTRPVRRPQRSSTLRPWRPYSPLRT